MMCVIIYQSTTLASYRNSLKPAIGVEFRQGGVFLRLNFSKVMQCFMGSHYKCDYYFMLGPFVAIVTT